MHLKGIYENTSDKQLGNICVGTTIPVIPHFTISLNSLCTFPHVCYTAHRSPHSSHGPHVSRRLHVLSLSPSFHSKMEALPDSNNKPSSQMLKAVFGLRRIGHVFMFAWASCVFEIMSAQLSFFSIKEGYL